MGRGVLLFGVHFCGDVSNFKNYNLHKYSQINLIRRAALIIN